MNNRNYQKERAHAAGTLYPKLRTCDIGFYRTLFRNESTGGMRVLCEWRPHGRPELRKNPMRIPAEWALVVPRHWHSRRQTKRSCV